MRTSIAILLVIVIGLAGCSKSIEGQLVQITSIKKLDDGWKFELVPNTQGLELLNRGVNYSIAIADPGSYVNYDSRGCSVATNIDPFPAGEGISVSFRSSGSQKRILFDGKQVLTCDRRGRGECLHVYSFVRLQGGDGIFFFDRVDPELIAPVIIRLCDAERPEIVVV